MSSVNGISGISGSYAPQAMSGASARMPMAQKMSNVFSDYTTPGSGVLTRSQFATAFGNLNPTAGFKAAGPDAVFSALDPGNTGAVSRQDFINGMKTLAAQFKASGY